MIDINKWIDEEVARAIDVRSGALFHNMLTTDKCAEVARAAALQIIGDRSTLITNLMNECHGASVRNGFYNDRETGQPIERNVGELLALCHSELSEWLEAYRTDAPPKHLVGFSNEAEQAADILIRIMDLAGYRKLPIGPAYVAKRAYNDVREDHKAEARRQPHGKKF